MWLGHRADTAGIADWTRSRAVTRLPWWAECGFSRSVAFRLNLGAYRIATTRLHAAPMPLILIGKHAT